MIWEKKPIDVREPKAWPEIWVIETLANLYGSLKIKIWKSKLPTLSVCFAMICLIYQTRPIMVL